MEKEFNISSGSIIVVSMVEFVSGSILEELLKNEYTLVIEFLKVEI